MRQTGLLTGACLWAMENMPKQIEKDNQITIQLAKKLGEFVEFRVDFESTQINMLNFDVKDKDFPHK